MTRKSSSVTIHDVARQAAVSIATVSRYINNSGPVSDQAADRIQRAMMNLKYVPHAGAQHLASQRTMTVGLLLVNMHNDFFGPLLYGVESEVRQQGYNLLVATARSGRMPQVIPPIGPHNTDGMLVFADSLDEDQLRDLYEEKFPAVLIHRTAPPDISIPCVTVENKAATAKLVSHLIEAHHCRKIVFLRGPAGQEDSYWRELGYRSALAAHGIEPDPDFFLMGEFEQAVAYKAVMEFLAQHQRGSFDAVFAGDDDAAVGVIRALKESGYRIPEDVAVAGFDDSRLSAYLNPPLTTVRAPTVEVGRIAARQLFHLLQQGSTNGETVERVTLLPTEIIYRRSCGCEYS